MIDAYTIGINLVLDSGISEGIAAIQRELVALDRAADNSAVGLKRLNEIAAELSAGRGATPAPATTPSKIPTVASAENRDEEVSRGGEQILPFQPTPEVELIPKWGIPKAQPDEISAPKAETPVTADATAPTWVAASPRVSEVTVQVPPLVRERQTEKGSAALPPREAKQESTVRSPRPTPRANDDKPRDADTVCAAPPRREPEDTQSRRLTPDSPADPRRIPASTAPVFAEPVAPPITKPTPRPDRKQAGPEARVPQESAPYAPVQPPKPEAPPSERGSRQQTGGQAENAIAGGIITLDGIALGRWIADYLTKKVSRPSAGFSGFDVRMNAAPIGATINS